MATHERKLDPNAKNRILELLSQDQEQKEIQAAIKQEFQTEVTVANISYYNVKYSERIKQMRMEFYQSEVFKYPIAHKGYRIRQLQNQFNAAIKDGEYRDIVQILRLAKDEIGEDVEKLAQAIAQSGGDHIVNLGILTTDPDELRRLISEQSQACGVAIPPDRM